MKNIIVVGGFVVLIFGVATVFWVKRDIHATSMGQRDQGQGDQSVLRQRDYSDLEEAIGLACLELEIELSEAQIDLLSTSTITFVGGWESGDPYAYIQAIESLGGVLRERYTEADVVQRWGGSATSFPWTRFEPDSLRVVRPVVRKGGGRVYPGSLIEGEVITQMIRRMFDYGITGKEIGPESERTEVYIQVLARDPDGTPACLTLIFIWHDASEMWIPGSTLFVEAPKAAGAPLHVVY